MAIAKKSLHSGVEEDDKQLLIRLPKKLHHNLKLLAFKMDISMAELCREGVELILEKYHKTLSKKDID